MEVVTRKGRTLCFGRPAHILHWGSVGGKKEGEGPLAAQFDLLFQENSLGAPTWEQSESDLQRHCLDLTLKKAGLSPSDLDLVLGGDLQNQCTATAYTMAKLEIPFSGLYGACSTMAQSLSLASCLVSTGCASRAVAMTSSHFCAAERQYRTPLVYGGKRAPTAQWTATAAGCCLVADQPDGPAVASVTFGQVMDFGVTDINNTGAAMAPAAAKTLLTHFQDTGTKPEDFDAIYTGDLGVVGSRLLAQLMEKEGFSMENHRDCGTLLYDVSKQRVHAGASGAGCSASVLCAHVLPQLQAGILNRILFLSTGALMSQTTFLQGQSIPSIAHLVELRASDGKPS